jgi:maltose alpha-D-glucosyltransferase / alpha-amylase
MVDHSIAEDSLVAALRERLPQALPEFLAHRRWFGGKARKIRRVEVSDVIPVQGQTFDAYFVLARVSYDSGPADAYDIPLVRVSNGMASKDPDALSVIRVQAGPLADEMVLADALCDGEFLDCLLAAIAGSATFEGMAGELRAVPSSILENTWQPAQGRLVPSLIKAEQSNSSIVYGQRLILKIFRRVEEGINPDLEIGLFLTEHTSFRNIATVTGHLEYVSRQRTHASLGMLQAYVANQGDAWEFTLKALAEYYENALRSGGLAATEIPRESILALADQPIPLGVRQRIGPYLESAALLGRRTAELHIALSSAVDDAAFIPQPLSEAEQQTEATSAMDLLTTNLGLLRRLKLEMAGHIQQEANRVLDLEDKARQQFQRFYRQRLSTMLTRIHGDYHLGQILFTGGDFVIIDFEGEPARSLTERRRKRSPLQDVAGMLRSFHYAAYAPLLQATGPEVNESVTALRPWAYYWQIWVSAIFLKTYLEVAQNASFVPESREDLALLLDTYILDKAVYELGYELNNRPTWVQIPLQGISQLLLDRV